MPDKRPTRRYQEVPDEKAAGATYTPKILSDFVAERILETATGLSQSDLIRVLDPAIGDGELLNSLLALLTSRGYLNTMVYGFETDRGALDVASSRLKRQFPNVDFRLEEGDFLEFVLEHFGGGGQKGLFQMAGCDPFDLIIANPPYVRTQVMGAGQAKKIAQQFGLSGRVDLYYAFIVAMAQVLKPRGVAGIIVSNRFMTTRSGACVRRAIRERFAVRHVWDMGDTKIFEAAVLPAVLLLEGRKRRAAEAPGFTSIYETNEVAEAQVKDPISALSMEGVVETDDGRRFLVQHGELNANSPGDRVWRIVTDFNSTWLRTVEAHTWGTFRDIGKIRVGVKTCADKVFIRSDWEELPDSERPELLRPVTTHHVARCFRAIDSEKRREIFYPHEVVNGQRQAVDLSRYPRSRAYVEKHRSILEARTYLVDGQRKWYEIWVPQSPDAWAAPKLVFRDIAEDPTFWIDHEGTVVNGDCYWIVSENSEETDMLWLAAAVGNSTFVKAFYDHRFHNRLYARRRRFMTQYVEQFPLPDPLTALGRQIISKAKRIYDCVGTPEAEAEYHDLDELVWQAFDLSAEEVRR